MFEPLNIIGALSYWCFISVLQFIAVHIILFEKTSNLKKKHDHFIVDTINNTDNDMHQQ